MTANCSASSRRSPCSYTLSSIPSRCSSARSRYAGTVSCISSPSRSSGSLGRWRIATRPGGVWTAKDFDDALFYGILGTIVGGRLGYVLFYKAGDYFPELWRIFFVWEGGMSFHGGMLGVIFAMWLFARRRGQHWLAITDFIAPLVPLGLAAGRLGNFINAELWGRPTDVPWAMIFPNVDRLPRHPSQLYELALEGLVLSPCSGGFRAGRARAAQCRAFFSSATASFASPSNSRGSPTASSAFLRSG